MHQKNAFQLLTIKFPLPREKSGNYSRYGSDRCDKQVVIGRRSQQIVLLPLRKKVKEDTDDKQPNRKVNKDDVLGMLREKYRFYVERMQGLSSLTAR
jgi:hypothetical protein